jgi:hypothetical protein
VTGDERAVQAVTQGVRVALDGRVYPAAPVARGAAYEVFSASAEPGFQRDQRPGALLGWHRFAHVSEVAVLPEEAPGPEDAPLSAPLSRAWSWTTVQRFSQSATHRDDPTVHRIRATAVVRRGTRMLKVLSPAQFAHHLGGALPYGFCYREYDVAHLRTPAELALLRTDGLGDVTAEVAYALRWRAVDPIDYEVPMGRVQPGLSGLPGHMLTGALVLGTGFAPSAADLIPEFVTAGFADLPLVANAQLVAFTPDGEEVVLYTYQPEQHGWLRLAGPRWRRLLIGLPGVNPDQDYVPSGVLSAVRLVGWIGANEYPAIADPPDEFRVRALTRAARYPVEALSRRAEHATWRGVPCAVLRRDHSWARLRLCYPDGEAVNTVGARCYERGVFETSAPVAELADHRLVDVEYRL